jgi:hypothetical protein
MRKYLPEMLEEINKDPSKIENYKEDFLLKVVFAHSFLPKYKCLLPEGEPPHKPAAEPLGMTPTNLFNECKRFYVFTREDMAAVRRESLFISMIEGVHPSEVKVLIAMKDQKLSKLYPKITWKLVSDAGIIPAPEKKEKKEKVEAP